MKFLLAYIRKVVEKIKAGKLKELTKQWRWILIYVRRYLLLVGVYTLLSVSGSLLGLGTSLVSRSLVDAVTGYNSQDIIGVAALYVGVGIAQIFIGVIRSRLSLRVSLKITNEIRSDIYQQILQTDWESLASFRTGDLLYRINGDAGMIANHVLTFLPNLVSTLISFGTAFVIMIQNDIIMAMISLGGAPITLITSRYSMMKMREYQKKNQEFSSTKMSFDQETFQNLQMVKAFGLVDTFIDRFHGMQERAIKISMDQNKYQSIGSILTSLTGSLIGYACYGFAIFRLWQGEISYGTMTMFVSMAGSLRGSFSSVVNMMPMLLRAGVSAGRIMEITGLPREQMQEDPRVQQMKKESKRTGIRVHMQDVMFWYEEEQHIYENVNFHAEPGEIIGLVGPSGQGKTTLLRLLLGLYHPKGGSITVGVPGGDSQDVSSATRCLFSYIPQGNILFSGTIEENLRLLKPEATEEDMIRVLKAACAWEFVNDLEEGIQTEVQEGGRRFSEGQKQRLCIARALLADAPIVLLDEATSALDMATEQRVLHNIIRSEPHRTLIVTAHRPSVFSMCSRMYRVQKGAVREIFGWEAEEEAPEEEAWEPEADLPEPDMKIAATWGDGPL